MNSSLEKMIADQNLRLDGLECAIDDSVPEFVGVLVSYLARTGVLDLRRFGQEVRHAHNPDLRLEDSTGMLLSRLADIVESLVAADDEVAETKPRPDA